jgi:ABC-type transporter MlaC component
MTIRHANLPLMISVLTVGVIVISNLIVPTPAFAATGKESVEKLVAIFKGWDANSASAKVFADASGYIDYGSMSEQALGADQWGKLKPAERADFTTALRKLVEERYYPRWRKLFSKGTLTYGKESSAHGDIMLDTTLKVNQKSQEVFWQLDNKGAQPKVISLKVDDKDLLSRLHERISPRLQKSGFKSLLSWLQNKAAKETDSN